ncbi:MAG: hypothetical protein AAGD10_19955 [Myxococcota bacterium]
MDRGLPSLLCLPAILLTVIGADGPTPLSLRQLEIRGRHEPNGPVLQRRVTFGTPPGWTPEFAREGPSLRLYGPEGEGTMLFAIATHPSQLGPYLDELAKKHPSSLPGPPQAMRLPRLVPLMGDRATRYVVTGRQLGEMVMVERRESIVLVATVVKAEAWAELSPLMAKVYESIQIHREPSKAPRHRSDHRRE